MMVSPTLDPFFCYRQTERRLVLRLRFCTLGRFAAFAGMRQLYRRAPNCHALAEVDLDSSLTLLYTHRSGQRTAHSGDMLASLLVLDHDRRVTSL